MSLCLCVTIYNFVKQKINISPTSNTRKPLKADLAPRIGFRLTREEKERLLAQRRGMDQVHNTKIIYVYLLYVYTFKNIYIYN